MATTAQILYVLSWVFVGISLGTRASEVEREFIAHAGVWIVLVLGVGEMVARWMAGREEAESED